MNIKVFLRDGRYVVDPHAKHVIIDGGAITVTHEQGYGRYGQGCDDVYHRGDITNFEVRPDAMDKELGYKLVAEATYKNNHKADLDGRKFNLVTTDYSLLDHTKFVDLRGDCVHKSFAWKKLKKLVIATGNLYS